MRKTNTDLIMEGMGFSPADTGPFVAELRDLVRDRVAAGLIAWRPQVRAELASEERARALLEIQWSERRGRWRRRLDRAFGVRNPFSLEA
jgi:IS5 family transposase